MSRAAEYAQFPYTPPKTHLTSAQQSMHHQYTQQQPNQFTSSQDGLLTQPPPSVTTNPQYTTSHASIVPPNLGTQQTRRYKTQQHNSISPPTPNTPNRQYSQNSLVQATLEHPPSPLSSNQCLPTTNNVTIPSTLPASLPTPPTTLPGLSSPNSGNSPASNFDLQDVLAQFGNQPELLKLILQSKVEEDKRKAEEAKLRVRELDLLLLDRDRQKKGLEHAHDVDESKNDEIHSNQDMDFDHGEDFNFFPSVITFSITNDEKVSHVFNLFIPPFILDNSIGPFSTSDGSLSYASFGASLSSPVQNLSLNSPSTPVSQSTPRLKPAPRINSTPKGQSAPQFPLHDRFAPHNNQLTSQNQMLSHNQAIQNDQEVILGSAENEESNANNITNKRKRKRREMLPVTMIIETKEYPYVDDYLWKNNGNTTQRKTGNKSVYFKCSNSNKGCPVNKTVTEKEGGWIIKYRGHHLDECGKIKRIVQS
ncbi:15090_t:CDS:2 [Funneliformis geosporum]|uniref:4771_t:CDS:1 n=1 Tax=Funneliformis geosporum TaxID=1117311 RepID=A0A9W4WWK5_9GLOM|nr:4771_t:CDS:2 [Funneliformis geosporum]CAI2180841.1 15090_t:CDS:2 [Funneliformis geosporum]